MTDFFQSDYASSPISMLLREMMVIFVANELDRTQNESVILYFKAFLNYCTYFERLNKTTNSHSQDNSSPGLYLKPELQNTKQEC
jgi:hypothetical protein